MADFANIHFLGVAGTVTGLKFLLLYHIDIYHCRILFSKLI